MSTVTLYAAVVYSTAIHGPSVTSFKCRHFLWKWPCWTRLYRLRIPHRMSLSCGIERTKTTSELRYHVANLLLRPSESRKYQMNRWLGEFWSAEVPFKMALIGDRESVGYSFLREMLGDIKIEFDASESPKSMETDFTVDGVGVNAHLVPSLSDAAGYKNEGYIEDVQDVMESADLVIYCINMSDTRLRGSVFRTLQQLKINWS